MKKLMIAAAIVCAAVMSQASTVVWQYTAGKVYDGAGGTTGAASGLNVYLINVADLSRADFLTAFNTAGAGYETTIAGLAKSSTTLNASSKISSKTESSVSGVADPAKAYYVIFNGDKAMLSDEKAGTFDSTNDKFTFTFASTNASGSKSTYLAANGLSSTKSGMAWYSAAAVPEPTSAMLLLLGVAGLALRRRRA